MFKQTTALVLSLMCFALVASADTTFVAGGAVSGIWDADGSPFVIQGDCIVNESLFVNSGVTVYFDGHYQIEVQPGGQFAAIGTATDSIYFTTDTLAHPEGWHSLALISPAGTVRINYCVFENSSEADRAACYVDNALIDIRRCTFRNNGFNNVTLLGDAEYGAALRLYGGARFNVQHCVFENNRANTGGAVASWLDLAEGRITDCVFRNNVASRAGALFCSINDQAVEIRRCLFENNSAIFTQTYFSGIGGAIWAENCRMAEGCVFRDNYAETCGGAIFMNMAGIDSVKNCRFEHNVADSVGGAIAAQTSSVFNWIRGCVFDGNQAENAGTLHIRGEHGFFITNNTIVHSTTSGTAPQIVNVPTQEMHFYNNVVAFSAGGPVFHNPPSVSGLHGVHYNAFFDNTGGDFSGTVLGYYGEPGDSLDYLNNQYVDPQFVDADAANYHLRRQSPLIDAGFYYPTAGLRIDPDSTMMDIGAFFYDQATAHTFDNGAITDPPTAPVEVASMLGGNLPNPFNAVTEIQYRISNSGLVSLKVYDVLGREVASLVNGLQNAGKYTVQFDGAELPSGVYIYRLQSGEFTQSRKLVLLK